MAEGNKAPVRRWLDEVLTQGNLRRVDELFAPNYALHDLWLSGEYQKMYNKWFGPESMCPIPLGDHKMEPFVKG